MTGRGEREYGLVVERNGAAEAIREVLSALPSDNNVTVNIFVLTATGGGAKILIDSKEYA